MSRFAVSPKKRNQEINMFVASAVFRSLKVLKRPWLQTMCVKIQAAFSSGEWGSGAGKGGGSGGAVRDAGGIFGKMEAAREEEYFRKLQAKQILKLKQHIKEEISHHEKMISQHKEAISRHVERIGDLKKQVVSEKSVASDAVKDKTV